MNRRSRLAIAVVWLGAGACNLFAYLNGGNQSNLLMTLLDAALALLFLVTALRNP